MKIDDILLLAYVDGELTPGERLEVEKAIEASADIAGRVELLEASRLPYQQAYARQKLPPVPDSLTRKIAELTQAYSSPENIAMNAATATGTAGTAAGANDPIAAEAGAPASRSAPVRSRMRVTAPWLAVAFVAGAFCSGIVLRVAPSAMPGAAEHAGSQVAASGVSAWVRAAAGYQQLYSRDTVAIGAPDHDVSARIVADIRTQDGLELRVPDLSSAGLMFKRVQRLRFNDKPLVQIVYLPKEGPPVALCVMKDAKPDAALAQQRVERMDVVTWRQAELSYALIAEPGVADLNEIGKQIAGSSVGAMFSQNSVLWQPING
jgi:anti-sigma factor RsiW